MSELEFEFDSVASQQRRMFVHIAAGILRDSHAAEDAVQEALLKAWRGLAGFRSQAEIDTWLVRIVINECFMLMRSRRLHRKNSGELRRHYLANSAPTPAELCLAEETRALVAREIGCSPAIYRSALLADLAIFANDATLVGVLADLKLATAATRRRRARLWLRERMQPYRDSHAI